MTLRLFVTAIWVLSTGALHAGDSMPLEYFNIDSDTVLAELNTV